MKINEYIDTLSFDKTNRFPIVENLFNNAKPSITFFGKRIITVSGYTGSMELDRFIGALARKGAYSDEPASSGLRLEDKKLDFPFFAKIVRLGLESDKQIRQANFLTRLFVRIREGSL